MVFLLSGILVLYLVELLSGYLGSFYDIFQYIVGFQWVYWMWCDLCLPEIVIFFLACSWRKMFIDLFFVCMCISSVVMVYGYLWLVAKRNALFCTFCRKLICLLLMVCNGIGGYWRMGITRALTRCILIFSGKSLSLYSLVSAAVALFFPVLYVLYVSCAFNS